MYILSSLVALALSAAASAATVNTDSVGSITADGQHAQMISAGMLDGTDVPLIQDENGSLCLFESTPDHRWFTTANPQWTRKTKGCEILLCQVATKICKCDDAIALPGLVFSDFVEEGKKGAVLRSPKKGKSARTEATISLDSLGRLFQAAPVWKAK